MSQRDQVLEQLRAAEKEGVTEKALCALGIPRIAIGAHIESLRYEGHRFASSTTQVNAVWERRWILTEDGGDPS